MKATNKDTKVNNGITNRERQWPDTRNKIIEVRRSKWVHTKKLAT